MMVLLRGSKRTIDTRTRRVCRWRFNEGGRLGLGRVSSWVNEVADMSGHEAEPARGEGSRGDLEAPSFEVFQVGSGKERKNDVGVAVHLNY